MKYSATIEVPKGLTALMSAIGEGAVDGSENWVKYNFVQDEPIPSYLIALVVGDLAKREIGPRSAVWAEEAYVDAAAFEFSETEAFITTAESIVGPYVWGRYDILCLPPSFPYGGMENPCLTFVTPTLLAGDKSLASVVAHEIAHSWMGNLVGCGSWEHFWLNEGHTVFLERKIMGRLKGDMNAPGGGPDGQIYTDFLTVEGITSLKGSCDAYVESQELNYTRLSPSLGADDPDDAFSKVPYEKGYSLLRYLEVRMGGPAVFEPYLLAYVQTFSKMSISSDDFKAFFIEYFTGKGMTKELEGLDWDHYFYGEGVCEEWAPVKEMSLNKILATNAWSLADAWVAGNKEEIESVDPSGWSSKEWEVMLDRLLAVEPSVEKQVVEEMIGRYKLTSSGNSEIRFRYQRLALKAGFGPEDLSTKETVKFLAEQGRMKFVRPLYREMFKNEATKSLAVETFEAHRSMYHNIAVNMIAKDLNLTSKPAKL